MKNFSLNSKSLFFSFGLAFIVFYTPFSVFSQRKTRIGFETGPTFDKYHIAETNSNLRLVNRGWNVMWGFHINHEINKNISLETGFIRRTNVARFNFENPAYKIPAGYPWQLDDFKSWQLPVRFIFNFPVLEDRLWISPLIGYCLAYRSNPGRGFENFPSSSGSGTMNSNSWQYNFVSYASKNRFYSLLETGVGIQYRVINKLRLSLNISYFTGFTTVSRISATVTRNSETSSFFATSTDECFNVRLGLSYPIASF